jgi:hypothetical protein
MIFNINKFHNIVMQVVCDVDNCFWNVCVGKLSKVYNGGKFKLYSIYA